VLVIELLGTFVTIRPKGTRAKRAYTVTYGGDERN
jgi:hypothetical protein